MDHEWFKKDRELEQRVSAAVNKVRPDHPNTQVEALARLFVAERAPLPLLRRGPMSWADRDAHRRNVIGRLRVLAAMKAEAERVGAEPEYRAYLDGSGDPEPEWLTALAADESYLDSIDEVRVNQSYDALKLLED